MDEEIIQKLVTFQHSRILVKTNSPDSILGLLNTQKIIKQLNIHDALSKITKNDLKALISEPYFIPSGTPLYTQMQHFQDKQERVGLIVNEHGEFIGLISLEDILEEIVGEFNLDFLSKSSKFSQDDDGGWIVDGSVTIRTLNKKLNLQFPIDGPKTLNGLVLEYFEDIPEPNTSFKIANHTMEVLQSHDRIVKSIKIYPLS
jgi:Mg2+/Co2+ transporter CorB